MRSDKELGMQRRISRRQFCQGTSVALGAGISGLSAAWFYQQARPGARILVLDNHD